MIRSKKLGTNNTTSEILEKKIKRPGRMVLLCGVFFVMTLNLWAFRFQPITADLSPTGAGAIHTFIAENTGNEPIALRIQMLSRRMGADGSEVNQDATDQFVVFPQQFVLRPGQIQAVRIQWRGDQVIDVERAFRIVAEQLPIDFNDDPASAGAIKIMFRYRGAVYILPQNPQHQVTIRSVTPDTREGQFGAEFIFENTGNAHIILNELQISVGSADDSTQLLTLQGDELKGITGENLLARSSRRVFLPLPDNLRGKNLTAGFTFNPVR